MTIHLTTTIIRASKKLKKQLLIICNNNPEDSIMFLRKLKGKIAFIRTGNPMGKALILITIKVLQREALQILKVGKELSARLT